MSTIQTLPVTGSPRPPFNKWRELLGFVAVTTAAYIIGALILALEISVLQ